MCVAEHLQAKGPDNGRGGHLGEGVTGDGGQDDVGHPWLVQEEVVDGFPGHTSGVSVVEGEGVCSKHQPALRHQASSTQAHN